MNAGCYIKIVDHPKLPGKDQVGNYGHLSRVFSGSGFLHLSEPTHNLRSFSLINLIYSAMQASVVMIFQKV